MNTGNNEVFNMNTNSVSDDVSVQVDANLSSSPKNAITTGEAPEVSLSKATVKSLEDVMGLDPSGSVRVAVVQMENGSCGYVPVSELYGDAGTGEDTSPPSGSAADVSEAGPQPGETVTIHARKARQLYNWVQVVRAFEAGQPLKAKIVAPVRGGLIVNVGHRAFMPASHVDVRPVSDLSPWAGQEMTVLVLRLDYKRMEAVVSRRALLEQERKESIQHALDTFKVGDRVKGTVRSMLPYGAFVEIGGGVDALLHVSDMSWAKPRIGSAHGGASVVAGDDGDSSGSNEAGPIKEGDELELVILRVDEKKGKINVGRKQLLPDPWADVETKFPVGSLVEGTVTSHVEYGVFVELEPGLEGMVHASEITHSDTRDAPSVLLPLGTREQFQVIDVDEKKRRIGLSKKALTADPWVELIDKYPAGSTVNGAAVVGVAEFGLFVRITDHIKGLVHRGEISWQETPRDLTSVYPEGTLVDVKVLEIDEEKKRVSLSMKQLGPSPWEGLDARLSMGDKLEGRVVRIAPFGAFVQVEPGVEGLVHISRLADERVETVGNVVKVGDEVSVTVVGLDTNRMRLSLSMETAPKLADAHDDDEGQMDVVGGGDRKSHARGGSVKGDGGGDGRPGARASRSQRASVVQESAEAATASDKRSAGTSLGDLLRDRFGSELVTIVSHPEKEQKNS